MARKKDVPVRTIFAEHFPDYCVAVVIYGNGGEIPLFVPVADIVACIDGFIHRTKQRFAEANQPAPWHSTGGGGGLAGGGAVSEG